MAWDGYRLPTFNNPVVHVQWGDSFPFLVNLDLNDWPLLDLQVYWGIKRGFRFPFGVVTPGPYGFPMMIKAPFGTHLQITAPTGSPLYSDWFFWSYSGFVVWGIALQVGAVSLGNPNQYEAAIVSSEILDWAAIPVTLPPGWPLP